MKYTKWNVHMSISSMLAALAGWIIAERALAALPAAFPRFLTVGIYCTILSVLTVSVACVVELVTKRYTANSKKGIFRNCVIIALLLSSAGVFILSSSAQYLYEISFQDKRNNIVLLLDTSSSLLNSDPAEKRKTAAKGIVDKMDGTQSAMLVVYSDDAEKSIDFSRMNNDTKELFNHAIDTTQPLGGTDYAKALSLAYDEMKQSGLGRADIFMFTDGEGSDDSALLSTIGNYMEKLRERNIKFYFVGLNENNTNPSRSLAQLATKTGGTYKVADNADALADYFDFIYTDMQFSTRLLLSSRHEPLNGSQLWYVAIRLLFFGLLGLLVGAAYSLVPNNNKRILLVNTALGLLSGAVMEIGCLLEQGDSQIMCVRLAVFMLVFLCVMPYSAPTMQNGARNEYAGHPDDGTDEEKHTFV